MANANCKDPDKFFATRNDLMLPKGALAGKVAFITGGGTGLGKGMATAFAALGAKVVIASRRLGVLEEAARDIKAATPGAVVVPVQLNVKDPAAIRATVDRVVAEVGLPNIVVNNAAGNFISPTERLSTNAFRTIIDTVLIGSAWVTLEFAKRLIAAEQGCAFLSITTPYARSGSAFVVPSATSKAGVEIMCKSLAAEWGKYGLRFNCIAPGPIYTEGANSRLDPTGQMAEIGMQKVPQGRRGTVEELANLASYMVSDYASWMNGSIVDFDGGQNVAKGSHFQDLHILEPEMWDGMEANIRGSRQKELQQDSQKKSKL